MNHSKRLKSFHMSEERPFWLLAILWMVICIPALHAQEQSPSLEELEQKVRPYSSKSSKKWNKSKAINIAEKYIRENKADLTDYELIRCYDLLENIHIKIKDIKNIDNRNYEKLSGITKKIVRTGGVRLSRLKIQYIFALASDVEQKNPSKGTLQVAGAHQLEGFAQISPNWLLKKYLLWPWKKPNTISKEKKHHYINGIKKFFRKNKFFSATSITSLWKEIGAEEQKAVSRMYKPMIYVINETPVESLPDYDNRSEGSKSVEELKQVIDQPNLKFTRKKLHALHQIARKKNGKKRLQWLATTHLIAGFLYSLPDDRFTRWFQFSSDADGTGRKKKISDLRSFLKNKQDRLSVSLYRHAKGNPEFIQVLRSLYAPALFFAGKYENENHAEMKIEEYSKKKLIFDNQRRDNTKSAKEQKQQETEKKTKESEQGTEGERESKSNTNQNNVQVREYPDWYKKAYPKIYYFLTKKWPSWKSSDEGKRKALEWIEQNRELIQGKTSHRVRFSVWRIEKSAAQDLDDIEQVRERKFIIINGIPDHFDQLDKNKGVLSVYYLLDGNFYLSHERAKGYIVPVWRKKGSPVSEGTVIVSKRYQVNDSSSDQSTSARLLLMKKNAQSKKQEMVDGGHARGVFFQLSGKYDFDVREVKIVSRTLKLSRLSDELKLKKRKNKNRRAIWLSFPDMNVPVCTAKPYKENGKLFVKMMAPKGNYDLHLGQKKIMGSFHWPPKD